MREMVEKEIDGKDYSITQFPTTKSLKTLQKLVKYAGEPMAMMAALQTKEAETLAPEKQTELIGKTVKSLCERIDDEGVVDLIKSLSSGDALLCDGKQVSFESHYQGSLDHLFKVVLAVIEVQYGNFFGAVASRTGSAPALKKK